MNIHELKAELELLYEESINLRDYTDNDDLVSEIDVKVVATLDLVLFNVEALISDIDDGMYEEDVHFDKNWEDLED
jgi:hypothetical protein